MVSFSQSFHHNSRLCVLLLFTGVLLAIPSSHSASLPPADLLIKWREQGILPQKMGIMAEFSRMSGCSGCSTAGRAREELSLSAPKLPLRDTVRVLVLLVDFPDFPAAEQGKSTSAGTFDSLFFTRRSVTLTTDAAGSMADYYDEVSRGTLTLTGHVEGWLRLERTYATYVGSDNGLAMSRVLTQDAIAVANEAGVDFSGYDKNGDGYVDALLIVHPGSGAESGGYGIWSHKGNLVAPVLVDGVLIDSYTMNPEEYRGDIAPIGVFCHEFGHLLGLPDLYDIDGLPASSQGLGKWSLMAAGMWNGNGRFPAHPDPWCKWQAGFLTPIALTENLDSSVIEQVQTSGQVFLLQEPGRASEYWLVENRQQVGFDMALPGSGLLVYHVDESAPHGNQDHTRYHVGLVQADGRNDLALGAHNQGDRTDPWPAGQPGEPFHAFSRPAARYHDNQAAGIAVWNISPTDSLMTVDLDIRPSRPVPVLYGSAVAIEESGDTDGYIEPGEGITISFPFQSRLLTPEFVLASARVHALGIDWENDIRIPRGSDTGSQFNASISLRMPDTLIPAIDSLTITLVASAEGSNGLGKGSACHVTLPLTIGHPAILLVDADRGSQYETAYQTPLSDLGHPSRRVTPDQLVSGEVRAADYQLLIWFTGDSSGAPLTREELHIMDAYTRNGGNFLFVSADGLRVAHELDGAVASALFGAHPSGEQALDPQINGVAGHQLCEGLSLYYSSSYPVKAHQQGITPDSADPCLLTPSGMVVGVSRKRVHGSVIYFAVPLENLDSRRAQDADSLLARVIDYVGGIQPTVSAHQANRGVPSSLTLGQNYPNPFNPTTTISFAVTAEQAAPDAHALLSVYNLLGQRVRVLFDQPGRAGFYRADWDGRNEAGISVASGVYFYTLQIGEQKTTRRMTLIR